MKSLKNLIENYQINLIDWRLAKCDEQLQAWENDPGYAKWRKETDRLIERRKAYKDFIYDLEEFKEDFIYAMTTK